jgi:FAD binding domain
VSSNVAMNPSTKGGTMTAPITMQIPKFRGDVITPDRNGYDDARAVWNGTVDRRPRLIVRCNGTADVAAAVRFARDRDLEIAVRGGGHNVAGTAVCDDGIVIDLSVMRAVTVDPVERTAIVQGGALWADVDHETQAHGLATTGGIVSHTGVGGVSLGGGIGWLMRKHGLTVDNLVEAELITAEGDIIRASANDHPDLFWALRGGGGNFGIVSSFRFTLHSVGPTVMAGPVFWAAEDTTDVLRFYREFVADAPDALGNVVRLGTIPPWPAVTRELHFRPAIAVASCYTGTVEDGERAVRALRQYGSPLVDLVGPTLYVDHQSSIDDTVPHGWHYYWKATNLTGMSDEVIDIIAEHAYGATSPRSYAAMFHLGGAVARPPGMPPPTPGATWSTTSSSMRHGSPSRTTPSRRRRPRGRENSSPP